jgi:hypothetical protein
MEAENAIMQLRIRNITTDKLKSPKYKYRKIT